MTNRQWLIWQLIDMSDKELMGLFGCNICDKYVTHNKPCPKEVDCDSLFLDWLKQEHKED